MHCNFYPLKGKEKYIFFCGLVHFLQSQVLADLRKFLAALCCHLRFVNVFCPVV